MSSALPAVAFACSIAALGFAGGVVVTEFQTFPYRHIHDGMKTIKVGLQELTRDPYIGQVFATADMTPADAAGARFERFAPPVEDGTAYLVNGGLNEWLELCPEYGCVAVAMSQTGEVIKSWPYRPDEIFAADVTEGAFPHDGMAGRASDTIRPLGVLSMPGGDLQIVHQSVGNMFPFAGGIARIDPEGRPRWFRFDYAHHWATRPEADMTLVPNLRVGDAPLSVASGPLMLDIPCDTGRPQIDGVAVLADDGTVLREIDVLTALANSNWSALLAETSYGCDPLHINFVQRISDSARDLPGGAGPGDLVISLRNVNAFLLLDWETEKVLHVERGSWIQQHSVHHVEGSKFLVLDNRGGDADTKPSRIVEVDLADGRERRVFPNPDTPAPFRDLYTDRGGFIDISPDRKRALVSFSGSGRAVEIDLADGRVLAALYSVHDMSQVDGAPDAMRAKAARANIYGMSYFRP